MYCVIHYNSIQAQNQVLNYLLNIVNDLLSKKVMKILGKRLNTVHIRITYTKMDYQKLFAERIGGPNFGKDTKIYKL